MRTDGREKGGKRPRRERRGEGVEEKGEERRGKRGSGVRRQTLADENENGVGCVV